MKGRSGAGTRVKSLAERAASRVGRSIERRRLEKKLDRLRDLLRQDSPTHTLEVSKFESLLASYEPPPEYGYDATSLWRRATARLEQLIELGLFAEGRPRRVLDLGCGDGVFGLLVEALGHELVLCDLEDWRVEHARQLRFEQADACKTLPFDDGFFDLVVSYNSFEHMSDPKRALEEIQRVCRVGGHLRLDFGPLYNSAYGLHAYRTLPLPFVQFLFAEELIEEQLQRLGINDLGRTRNNLQDLNRWSLERFRALWDAPGLEVQREQLVPEYTGIDLPLRYPDAFRGRSLNVEELTTSRIDILIHRHD